MTNKRRWLPRDGEPLTYLEWLSQSTIRFVAYLPIYTAIVVTLVLLAQIFDIQL